MVKTVIPGFIFSGPNMSALIAVPAVHGKAATSSYVRCAGAGSSSLSGCEVEGVFSESRERGEE